MSKPISTRAWVSICFAAAFFISLVVSGLAEAAAKKIIFFTIGQKPNAVETTEIARLTALATPQYEVKIMRAQKVRKAETADYIAGTIPPVYRAGGVDSGATIYPEMGATVIANGQTLSIAGGGSLTFEVSGTRLTSITYVPPDGGT